MRSFLRDGRFLFLFVLLVPGIMIFHRLGETYLAGDDTYYSQIAKEMARSGDYLTPRYAGRPDFHTSKPPLLYWMNALSGKAFGFGSFGMRFPSALLGFAGVIALFFFVRRYFDVYTAFAASLILAFTQQYLYHARSAVTDGPFAVLFALTLMAFWVARTEKKDAFFYVMGLFLAMTVMTRQAAGFFVLPVIAAYIVFAREYALLKRGHLYGGMLLAAALIIPWHAAMYRMYGKEFIDTYMGVMLKTGITGYPAGYSSSPSLNPWYAYFDILLSNYWPWLPFLAVGIVQSVKGYRRFDDARRRTVLFVLLWSAVPFLIFQAAKVKQFHYIMPLYFPFAILSGAVFARFGGKARDRALAALMIVTGALAVTALAVPLIPRTLDSHEFDDTMLLIPAAKNVDGDILTVRDGCCHYSSSFMFYGDKKVVVAPDDEVAENVRAGLTGAYVMSKENAARLWGKIPASASVIAESEKSILFEVK